MGSDMLYTMDDFLFLNTCSWIKSEDNSESSRLSLVVSMFKTILSAYWNSVIILRDSEDLVLL